MKYKWSPEIFLPEIKVKEFFSWKQNSSFLKSSLAEHQHLTYFKLQVQACLICLNTIVKMSNISCLFFITFLAVKVLIGNVELLLRYIA